MNLKFWKKKKVPEESGNSAADETVVATEADPTPEKPGFWTRLKSKLSLSRKKIEPNEADEAGPSAGLKGDKPHDEESATPPPKPGFLARLKSFLLPARKKNKTEDEEKPEERKPSTKRTDKSHRDEELEPSDVPTKKSGKKLVIALALLIPLAAGGGFFAAMKLLPKPQHKEVPLTKDAASQEVKVDGQPAPEPTEATEQAPQPQPEQPLTETAPQQADNAAAPATEVPEPQAETPVAEAPAEEDVQAQIQAMKKQNQEMQAQIEALKKQPTVARPARSATSATPREGVLIINGKNAKESAQGLKKVIEGMNADSGITEKK
jgi:flagellar basal body-associated protein FliL